MYHNAREFARILNDAYLAQDKSALDFIKAMPGVIMESLVVGDKYYGPGYVGAYLIQNPCNGLGYVDHFQVFYVPDPDEWFVTS